MFANGMNSQIKVNFNNILILTLIAISNKRTQSSKGIFVSGKQRLQWGAVAGVEHQLSI